MHALRKFVQDQMDTRNWRAADLAARSGISKQVISGLLTDDRDTVDRMPTEKTIAGLCKAFSVSRDAVLAVVGEAMGLPVGRPTVIYDASRVPNDELIRELARRLGEAGGEHVHGSAPITPAGGSPATDNVRAFPRATKQVSLPEDTVLSPEQLKALGIADAADDQGDPAEEDKADPHA